MSDDQKHENMSGGELVYRVVEPEAMRFQDPVGDSQPVLEGRMLPYGEWTEVKSPIEGHFMERFEPGALAKTMAERAAKIRVMFEHGMDSVYGNQAIAAVDEMRDEPDGAHFRATLLRGVPDLLLDGLRRGLYGTSIRFGPVKWDRVRFPERSDHNPEGIPEHTIREAFMKEFSVTPFPQYQGSTAHVRSMTDDIMARQLLRDPERLLELVRTSEPQHSPEPDSSDEPEQSRSTQQPRTDHLAPGKGETPWRL